jgi:hypothetical protein
MTRSGRSFSSLSVNLTTMLKPVEEMTRAELYFELAGYVSVSSYPAYTGRDTESLRHLVTYFRQDYHPEAVAA